MPLEGEDGGVGSFLGNICSQNSLGNLEASDDDEIRRMKKEKSKNFCLRETNMLKNEEGDALVKLSS